MYSGITGKIEVKNGGQAKTACLASFDLDLSKEIIEAFCFGDEYKKKVPGMKDWTASTDGTADLSDGGQKLLYDAFESGDEVECTFSLNESTFFKGDALIESISISHAADGKADISMSLSGSGGITLTI